MKGKLVVRINTLEDALQAARKMTADLRTESKARRNYRIFATLTADRLEALTAYLIWHTKAQSLGEVTGEQRSPSSTEFPRVTSTRP